MKLKIFSSISIFLLVVFVGILTNNFIIKGVGCNGEKAYTILKEDIYYKLIFPFGMEEFCGVLESKKNGLLNIVEYKNGLRNGKKRVYFKNGNLKLEADFKNNKLEGKLLGWNESGHKLIDMDFRNDLEDGFIIEWYSNGSPKMKSQYKNGKKDGVYMTWYKNTLPPKEWVSNSFLKTIGFYLEDKKNGEFITLGNKGKVLSKTKFINDKEVK